MKHMLEVPKAIWRNKKLLLQLSKNDFKTKFAGSMFGRIWGFIQPLVMILVYWFAFEKGIKIGTTTSATGMPVPFLLWLIAGLVPWFFFSDALSGGVNALTEYSYLVKKVVFEISILPLVKIISAVFTHFFFLLIIIVLYYGYGFSFDVYSLQIFYFSFAMFVLCAGLAYLNSAIVVFFKDWSQVIGIILQVGIWMTPVMWRMEAIDLPSWVVKVLKLNPMFYIVQGYRDALINKIWFWENARLTIYFWGVVVVMLLLGTYVFQKLRSHFADVL